jgi:hypothetical protein
MRSPRSLRWLASLLPLLLQLGCVPHFVLRARNSPGTLGPLQRCAVDNGPCGTDPSQDGSRFNNSNTQTFVLPACPHGIDSILVEAGDAAIVQCAAPGQPSLPSTTTTPP